MDREILDGWAEIADHLSVTTRTAQQWEKTGTLPVHRKPGKKKPRVYAFTDELNEWRSNRLTRQEANPRPNRKRILPLAAGIAALIAATFIWSATKAGPPATWRVAGATLEVALST